jgi:hypothetical protein
MAEPVVFCEHYKTMQRLYIKYGRIVALEEMAKHHPKVAGTPCRVCLEMEK